MQDFFIIAVLMISMSRNLTLSFWCLRFREQRDDLLLAYHEEVGLYEPMNAKVIAVLDQIEGVKKKKEERD